MSAAGEECSFWMHTNNYIGSAVANADLFLWISMTMTIRLLGAPSPMLPVLIFCIIPIPRILVMMSMTVVVWKHVTQLDNNLMVVDWIQYWLSMLQKKRIIHQPFQKHAIPATARSSQRAPRKLPERS